MDFDKMLKIPCRIILLLMLGCGGLSAAEPLPLVRELKPLSIRGVNYYPQQTPWGGMWTQTAPETWDRDMALAASLGINTIRTFITFGPPEEKAGLMQTNGTPTAGYLEKIDRLLAAASRNGIRAILCFEFNVRLLASADSAPWKRALTAVVTAHRDDGRVLLWDVMNEPDDDAKWTEPTRAYLKEALGLIPQLDPNHRTTIGLCWRIDRLAGIGLPDVIQYHEYSSKKVLFEKGVARVSQDIANLRHGGGTRPLLIGEFGMCTARDPEHGVEESLRAKMADHPGSESEQVRIYEAVLTAAEQDRVAGVLPWCLFDYAFKNPNESHFGLVRLDGSLKPAAGMLQRFYQKWKAAEKK